MYHQPDYSLTEEQRQSSLEESQVNDPEVEPLRGIAEDQQMSEGVQGWGVRMLADQQVFLKEDASTVNYSPVLFNNHRWPGTRTIAANGVFCSIYIGYGYKGETQALFYPQEPNNINEDPEEQEEKPEPNPKNPMNEVEPDSDDEKKQEEEEDY